MVEVELIVKKWGRSFGAVIPMKAVKYLGIKENDTIKAAIFKEGTPMEKTFGTIKFRRPIKEILNESNREDWDE